MIDIIIPVLNEEKILIEQAPHYRHLKTKANVIFVDGGSTDRTVQIAQDYGDVLTAPRGRALQKNAGASTTRSKYILFLHVDSSIEDNALEAIEQALDRGVVGGCLTMHIDDDRWLFRIYEKIINGRAKIFSVLDGDLGLFVERSIFEQVGSFDAVPIMEDIKFSVKLRRAGPIQILPQTIHVSSRKWHAQGFGKTFFLYTLAYLQLWTGWPFFKDERRAG